MHFSKTLQKRTLQFSDSVYLKKLSFVHMDGICQKEDFQKKLAGSVRTYNTKPLKDIKILPLVTHRIIHFQYCLTRVYYFFLSV